MTSRFSDQYACQLSNRPPKSHRCRGSGALSGSSPFFDREKQVRERSIERDDTFLSRPQGIEVGNTKSADYSED
jgi:hypothetical protein